MAGMVKNGPKPCGPMYWEVIWHIKRFPGWFPALELACHCDLIFTSKISHFWPHPAEAIWLKSAKMVPYHHPICLRSLLVQPVPKVSRIVVATAMRVTKKAQKWRKMATKWPISIHRNFFYGTETILTSISIGTHDLVRFLALSDIWKYRLRTTFSYFYGCHERSQPLSNSP